MDLAIVVFAVVYVGMFLGELPRLQLDRTGIALLGALALVATGTVSLERAAASVDLPTLALLFGLMVLSAQLRLGGFYREVTFRLSALEASPATLLAAVIGAVGALSAVFTNDVVCLAVTPVVIETCSRRRLDPVPFLLGVACSANVGSAATLIGNPQNMLVGQVLGLSFAGYLGRALLPTLAALAATWAVVAALTRGRWTSAEGTDAPSARHLPAASAPQPFDRWQTSKGLSVAAVLVALFLFSDWPRDLLALGAAGLLLTSRRLQSRDMLSLVDWALFVLFAGLFVVNDAFQQSGLPARAVEALRDTGIDAHHPAWLFVLAVVLSNLVSNVPAVMLLLPMADHPLSGPTLAMASTLAGNLIVVGSIANIIVVDIAAAHGIAINWRAHARVGVPVTLVTLAIAAAALRLG